MTSDGGHIHIRGARTHSLQNVELRLPRGKMTVITGVSGSGKSSLAFDTLYAEGRRRFLESLSARARAAMEQTDKPDVDFIHGLSPVIAVEQRTAAGANPRDTVASVTEIADYARLLWSAAGERRCPRDGGRITRRTLDDCIEKLLTEPAGSRVLLLAPREPLAPAALRDTLDDLVRRGFRRARVAGRLIETEDPAVLASALADANAKCEVRKVKGEKTPSPVPADTASNPRSASAISHFPLHTSHFSPRDTVACEIVIDRLALAPDSRARLADSLELAFREGKNRAIALVQSSTDAPWREIPLSLHLACECCGDTVEPLTPRHFSPNRPEGACPTCAGLGKTHQFAAELVVPDPSKKLTDGAIKPWKLGSKKMITARNALLRQLAEQAPFDLATPWRDLPAGIQKLILEGDPDRDFTLKPGRAKAVTAPWRGVFADLEKSLTETESEHLHARLHTYRIASECPACAGARLNPAVQAVTLAGRSIADFYRFTVEDAAAFIQNAQCRMQNAEVAPPPAPAGESALCTVQAAFTSSAPLTDALQGMSQRLRFLSQTGLAYLPLDREFGTLSGGEIQRVRLATQLGLELVGVTYVLDEPSIGLHPADHARLLGALTDLRDRGNTLVVVEHDRDTMLLADHIVEMGPGAGPAGGRVVFAGDLAACRASRDSRTGAYLTGLAAVERTAAKLPPATARLLIRDAAENNLQKVTAEIPVGRLTAVCGVSGSGKSTLALDILGAVCARRFNKAKIIPGRHAGIDGLEDLTGFVQVTQDPIGRSARSNPATFTGIFDHLRELFAGAPLSKIRGYEAGRFSFNLRGGRCEKCQGDGTVALDMQFLGEAVIPCPSCAGARYNRETLEVRHKGLNIAEVLDLTVADAHRFFKNHARIAPKLATLEEVGLGYLKLGQPADTLSGGEAQRLKLADELGKRKEGGCLYLLDEPTTGLHWDDVQKLLSLLFRLRDAGNTVVVIEHHTDILRHADHLIELGPGGGRHGGALLFSGPPDALHSVPGSPTGRYL